MENSSGQRPILGGVKIIYFGILTFPVILLVILILYQITVTSGDQYPYPWLSITSIGLHYPQCLIFRYGMGLFSPCFMIFYHRIFKWMKESAVKNNYKRCTYGKMYWPTILSVHGYFFMVATIDSAGTTQTKYERTIHWVGAMIFLLPLGLLMFNSTIFWVSIWRKNHKFMKVWSLLLKIICFVYLNVYIIIYTPLSALWQHYYLQYEKRQYFISFINKMEWNLVIFSLIWMCSIVFDLKDVKIILISPPKLLKTENVSINPEIPIDQNSEMKISQSKSQINVPETLTDQKNEIKIEESIEK